MNKEYVLEKLAFIVVNPFTVKDKKELQSVKGYAKEKGNAFTSFLTGGALSGAAAGLLTGALTKDPKKAQIAAGVAAGLGAITSDIRSTRATERKAGVKPMGVGKYLGRGVASTLAQAAIPIPGVNLVSDYLVSRKLQKYEDA